jgi:DNA modification methylase
MSKRKFKNRLNDLEPKQWIKFQKSWFVHNPPPRRKDVLQHPAKFPESLAQEFIEFFTKRGQTVLDPMVGAGSTLVACLRSQRRGIGIELNPDYVTIAHDQLEAEKEELGAEIDEDELRLIQGNAANLDEFALPPINYVLTSPPYWDMLHSAGSQTQQQRRADDDLDVVYSDSEQDLGNINDYDTFLRQLVAIYTSLAQHLVPRAYMTIVVKNIKKGGQIFPLAWDLAGALSTTFTLKDERIWCQDNIRLAPYGMGNAWVSNTFHHYCLQFRYEP